MAWQHTFQKTQIIFLPDLFRVGAGGGKEKKGFLQLFTNFFFSQFSWVLGGGGGSSAKNIMLNGKRNYNGSESTNNFISFRYTFVIEYCCCF
jgi:hypothetical protein